MNTARSAHQLPPAPTPQTLPRQGGNVWFVDNQCACSAKCDCNCETVDELDQDMATVGGMFALVLLAIMVGVFIIAGYGWAHLEAYLWALVK